MSGETDGAGWDIDTYTRDPGCLCGVEGQGKERQGLQDEVRALAVQEGLRGRGLAPAGSRSHQARRLQEWVAGSEYKLVVDLAACMEKEGVGFYAW